MYHLWCQTLLVAHSSASSCGCTPIVVVLSTKSSQLSHCPTLINIYAIVWRMSARYSRIIRWEKVYQWLTCVSPFISICLSLLWSRTFHIHALTLPFSLLIFVRKHCSDHSSPLVRKYCQEILCIARKMNHLILSSHMAFNPFCMPLAQNLELQFAVS